MARVPIARSKRFRKRRTPYGRKMYRSSGMRSLLRPYRSAARPIYSYKQTALNPTGIGSIAVPAGSTFLNAYSFNLNQVGGNLGAFSNLYDQYKINKVVIQYVPKFTDSDIGTAPTGGQLSMFASCIDYDDAIVPVALGDILEHNNCKLHRTRIVTRVIKPCVNFAVSTGATAGVSTKQSPWLDMANTNVPHFGVKIGITGTSVPQAYDVIVKYYISFRQVR